MRLIDANVFIYAGGAEHHLKEPCLEVLRQVEVGLLEATTDVEVLQELLNYYQRRGEPGLACGAVEQALSLISEPIVVDTGTIVRAARTLLAHPHLQARDAVHAAVVIEHNLEGIISADRGFDAIPGVTRFDPASL